MNKKTFIAVLFFCVLLVGAFFTLTQKRERGIERLSFANVETSQVDKIVTSGKNAVEIVRSGDTWTTQGKRADASAVKRLLESVPKIESTDYVSRNSERYDEMEVDAEKGTHVQLYAKGQVVAEFTVGKSAPGGGVHVRQGEDVYLIKNISSSIFSRDASGWFDRKLFDDKLEDVNKVTVHLAGVEPYDLVKEENKWKLSDPSVLPKDFRFDQDAASRLVSSLLSLRATEVVLDDPGAEKTGFADAHDVFHFYSKSGDPGQKGTLELGHTEEQSVYAKVGGRGDLYKLAKGTADALRKKPTDLRSMSMVVVDQNKIDSLSIVGPKGKVVLEKKEGNWSVVSAAEKIPDDFQLDKGAVTRRLSSFSSARGTDLVDEMSVTAAGLSRPSASITATLEDGSHVALAFGREVDADGRKLVYAQGNADKAVYRVTT
ncbi:MAG: DUF4340 domain-containing protein [Myxococcota bacterium]